MNSIDIKLLNKILSNLSNLPYADGLKKVQKTVVKDISDYPDGAQGESSEYHYIFKIEGTDLYLRADYNTDSYGSNDFVSALKIVKPTTKEVVSYEQFPGI